jgi:uncharacterized protein YoxC
VTRHPKAADMAETTAATRDVLIQAGQLAEDVQRELEKLESVLARRTSQNGTSRDE